ncbi:carbohydrate ABC transporter permease [Thermatribacter velox]|uniref:Maltose/maltodextrin transport system permease protein MalG n=1 Tax=Thermatribacter velox TaxID=3039681 RepID=A0ABZ2YC07_9BACT
MKAVVSRGKYFIYPIVVFLLLILLFPFFVMVSTAFKPLEEVYANPPHWIPREVRLQNFVDIWSKYPLGAYFRNSFIIAAGTTLLNMALCIPAAYAAARINFRSKSLVMYLFLVVQMFSPVIVIISLFKIISSLGLLDNLFALVLTNGVFTLAFSIWLLSGYFRSIPKEIEEASLIDGCSRLQSVVRVLLPVAMPGLVTTIIYTFITAWNEFMFALTFITSMEKRPLTLGLYNFIGRWTVQWHYLMAAALLALLPVVFLFLFIEKELVQGLAGGAIKG